jgi:hypothetical protein
MRRSALTDRARRRRGARYGFLTFAAASALCPAPRFALADEVYQSTRAFLAETFADGVPAPRVLWLRGETRRRVWAILGHGYSGIRVRYWRRRGRSAWVLEEIGKYKPITAGIVIDDGRIARAKVLVYRESHGWEVRHPFFTDQFRGVRLGPNGRLSRRIDGISGATLSVGALTRLARLALFLHGRVSVDVDAPK